MTDSPQEPKYAGARFYKCALQVNPCTYAKNFQGGSVQDEEAYNQAILEQCKEHDIKIVGLANHGNVGTSQSLRDFLAKNSIVVFPGFEISSSEKIHMVCLYPQETSPAQLNQYLGQLMGKNASRLNDTPEHPSSKSCEEIAKTLKEQKGFWYAAHMTGKNGLLRLTGAGDNYVDLWKKSDLVIAGQIPGTPDDLEEVNREDLQKYKQIIENKNPDYKRDKPIVVINAKDIDKPETLAHPSASCLIKMTEPTFEAFCMAFKDPESRIRLNHEAEPEAYSYIKSIQWEGGGFFEEAGIGFSKRLNAIVGGCGTGKSTLVESIRYVLDLEYWNASGNKSLKRLADAKLADSKITVKVKSQAQNGQEYIIRRRHGEQPQVINPDGEISHMTPSRILPGIDLIGQNEIIDIESSDDARRRLLQRFLPDYQPHDNDLRDIKEKLKDNRQQLLRVTEAYDKMKGDAQQAPRLKEQLEQFKKAGIEDKLRHVKSLEREKGIRVRIEEQFYEVETWLNNYSDIFDLEFLDDKAIDNLPGKEVLIKIRSLLTQLKTNMDRQFQQLQQGLATTQKQYNNDLLEDWKRCREAIRNEQDKAIARLPGSAGKSGQEVARQYQSQVRQLEKINRQQAEYIQKQKDLITLQKNRQGLLEAYRDAAFSRYDAMRKAADAYNKGELKGKVRINVSRCTDLENLKQLLLRKEIKGVGAGKIQWLDKWLDGEPNDTIDLISWSEWIEKKEAEKFVEKYGRYGLTLGTAEKLCEMGQELRLEMEEIELEDTIDIALNVSHADQKDNYVPLEKLSTGQKCTAILSLLLVNRQGPLIIDQPEDNLDNAFIADRIVSDIRSFKDRRQFLFTTHNANIPVFGDAELIAVLSSDSQSGRVLDQGSIDKDEIREQAAKILEGGKEAFNARKSKYGF